MSQRKWKSGTTLAGTDLRPEGVCLILEAGAKFGVRELSYAGLSVKFGISAERDEIPPPPNGAASLPLDLTDEQHHALERTELETDELLTREDQLAELLVTDPLKYEEMLQNGDLTDDRKPDSDDVDGESDSE